MQRGGGVNDDPAVSDYEIILDPDSTAVTFTSKTLGGKSQKELLEANQSPGIETEATYEKTGTKSGTLTLKNINFICKKSTALVARNSLDLTIELVGTNKITCTNESQIDTDFGINSASKLIITGKGSLEVSSGYAKKYPHGICAYSDITINGGATVIAKGGDCDDAAANPFGIRSENGSVTISGEGTNVTATGGSGTATQSVGIYADNSLTINGGATVNAKGGDCSKDPGTAASRGIESYRGSVTISGEGTNVTATGGGADESVGIKAKTTISIDKGAKVVASANANTTDKGYGIYAESSGICIKISNSDVTATGKLSGYGMFVGTNGTRDIENSHVDVSCANGAFNSSVTAGEIIGCFYASGEPVTTVETSVKEFECFPSAAFSKATFETDHGEAPDTQRVFTGSKLTEPVMEDVNDYIFLGWYDGDLLWDFDNNVVTKDITLTAKWLEVKGGVVETKTDSQGNALIKVTSQLKELTVVNGNMSICIGEDSLGSLVGKTLTVTLTTLDSPNVFEIVTKANGSSFKGDMTVSVPYDSSKGTPTVKWLTSTGAEEMPSHIDEKGNISFETDHNSVYYLDYGGDVPPTPTPSSPDNSWMIALIVVLAIAVVALIGVIVFKARKE